MAEASCPQCGNGLREHALFCAACGHSLSAGGVDTALPLLQANEWPTVAELASLLFSSRELHRFAAQLDGLANDTLGSPVFWLLDARIRGGLGRSQVVLGVTDTEFLMCGADGEVSTEPLDAVRAAIPGHESVTVVLDDGMEMAFGRCRDPNRAGWFHRILSAALRAPAEARELAANALGLEVGAPTAAHPTVNAEGRDPRSAVRERLAALDELHDDGAISDEEHATRRAEIIGEICRA